jgi:hypothetical protein
MADTKISALPASTTPLAGTEVLPIVQGGVTKQVSVANLTAGRAVSASTMTAGQVYSTGTYTDGATTPSVLGVSHLVISNSGATSITNFTNAVNGQIITLIFTDANTTVTRNNAYLSLGLNFTSTANDTLTLIYRGSEALWYEVCRSVNA